MMTDLHQALGKGVTAREAITNLVSQGCHELQARSILEDAIFSGKVRVSGARLYVR